jgi:hypothetical protein
VQKLVAIAAGMRKDTVISTIPRDAADSGGHDSTPRLIETVGAAQASYEHEGGDIMTAENDSGLDELTRRYPGWRIWRGHATGDVWALPPRDHQQHGLLSARDADALAAKVAEITSWDSSEQSWAPTETGRADS